MKFKLIFFLIFMVSCTAHTTKIDNRIPYNSKGFAYIFNENDFNEKLIKGKLDNSKLQISNKNLKVGSFVKIINPRTKDSVTVKNSKKIEYPDFYKLIITKKVAEELNLNSELPLVEIIEIKKNKSFIAKKAKIYKEEEKISSNAPVASVKISNISKNKSINKNIRKDQFYILIGTFYSNETAKFLKKRITKEIPEYDTRKLIIRKKTNKEINLFSGPYKTINLMKNDYIILKEFGFEELDITINE